MAGYHPVVIIIRKRSDAGRRLRSQPRSVQVHGFPLAAEADLTKPHDQLIDVVGQIRVPQTLYLATGQRPKRRGKVAGIGELGLVDQHRYHGHAWAASQGNVDLLDDIVLAAALKMGGQT